MVPMRGGVRLATDIYQPEPKSGPLPVIFTRGPYGKGGAEPLSKVACPKGLIATGDILPAGWCVSDPGLPCFNGAVEQTTFAGSRILHPGGVNSLMGDGSVRFIKNTINPVTWLAPALDQQRRGHQLQPVLKRLLCYVEILARPEGRTQFRLQRHL